MSCAGDNWIVPGANPCNNGGGGGTAGVTSLNSFQGAVSITAGNASIGVSNQGGNIVLTASGLQAVDSINGESGILTFNGTGATTISNTGSAFTIDTTIPANVGSVNSLTGALTLGGTGATTVTNVGNAISVNTTLPSIVNTVNSLVGALTIDGTGATTVTNVGNAISVNTTIPANVGSVNSLTGALTIGGTGATTVSNVGNAISVNTTLPSIVNTLNTLSGAVTLTGGTNVSLVPSGNNITINATAGGGGVSSVESQTGAVTFSSTDGSVSFTSSSGNIDFSAVGAGGVLSINTLNGNLDLVSTDGSVTVTSAGSAIDLSIPPGHTVVDSIAGETGVVTLSSSDNTVIITPSGGNIDLTAVASVPRPSFTLYVAPNGNDTTGTGSIALPFATIQKAIDYRLASLNVNTIIEIIIFAGEYNENLNIIWGNTIFTAYSSLTNNSTQVILSGTTLNIALTSVTLEQLQPISFNNFQMANNIAITTNSTILTSYNLSFNNCYIQGSIEHNTNVNNSIITYTNCKFYSNVDLPLINNFGCRLNIFRCNIEHGNAVSAPIIIIQNSTTAGTMGKINLQYSIINSSLSPNSPGSSTMAPLIYITGYNSSSGNYIVHNTLMYEWATADVSGNKCCIQFNKSTGSMTFSNVSYNSFLCDGAITGSPQTQCIQRPGVGGATFNYFGGNYAGANAHHIDSTLTITSQMTEVV